MDLLQGTRRDLWQMVIVNDLGDQIMYLLLYVDDIVLTASSNGLLWHLIASLRSEFSITNLGALNYFLAIAVTQILNRVGMLHCKPVRTPTDTSAKFDGTGPPVSDPTLYRSLAGVLQYLTFTRPDITCDVQQVTLDHGLQLYVSPSWGLIAYSDADWVGCPFTQRSTSGYCVFLGQNLLSWSSKRQGTISRSSAEAEYWGVANAVAETCWLRNLLHELLYPPLTATLVYCNNVVMGQIRVLHVPSSSQYADIFTKGLPSALFLDFRSSLNV
ncbi:uncharacterized mitochondrial protein AtMg00810-like [Lactuca sativa]|uniref:uncharacterized mitochondrial protein AtMg00810-like n=1 Tax=Lactuca sativa TaxID=4236 RepID=UPI000CD8E389|nr:uncharacterized mitochondrial protein AtMg00810-like [Lactuca sativa]